MSQRTDKNCSWRENATNFTVRFEFFVFGIDFIPYFYEISAFLYILTTNDLENLLLTKNDYEISRSKKIMYIWSSNFYDIFFAVALLRFLDGFRYFLFKSFDHSKPQNAFQAKKGVRIRESCKKNT